MRIHAQPYARHVAPKNANWVTRCVGMVSLTALAQCSLVSREAPPAQLIAAPAPSQEAAGVSPAGSSGGTTKAASLPVVLDAGVDPVPQTLNPPGYANLDPSDDLVEGPPDVIADCEERLKASGIAVRAASLPIVKKGRLTCGSEQVVQYLRGPTPSRIYPLPLVTCQLALALGRLEEVANRTAKEVLGTEISSIRQGGTYSCRSMARFKIISEHSFANAIDIFAFKLKNGRNVEVLRFFGDPKKPAATPEGKFLRVFANRLFDEQVCSVVVTRFYDELHRDHIHCDMAHYRVDGSR